MNKRDFYIAALKAGTYKKTAWNITCYALTQEAPNAWEEDPYPYRVVQRPNGYYFVDPETNALSMIDGAPAGSPLFYALEGIQLLPKDADNVYDPLLTTYGNLLSNYFTNIYGFGGKIPFITGRYSPSVVEKQFTPRMIDTYYRPDDGYISSLTHSKEEALKAPIYLEEYLLYQNAVFSMVAYTQLFTPADSAKTLTAPPGLIEFRNKLVEKYKGRLHQRETVGQIAKELVAYDTEYLKGDVSEGFLISKKSRNVVRLKTHLMYGAETGIEEKVDVTMIEKSLSEGWDVTKFPEYNNAQRAGSYNRGKQTESGGEAFKDLIRATANLKINVEDCGAQEGEDLVTSNPSWLIGFTVIENDKSLTKINKDNSGNYLGKLIKLRSPAFCLGDGTSTGVCKVCLGDRLSNNPTGLSIAIADYGSAFLDIFLSAAHSKPIILKKLEVRSLMS